jgi:ribosomal protein S1
MDNKLITGTVTFIHHDKHYVTIEYEMNGKKKSINGNISSKEQLKLKAEKIIKKEHKFQICDTVSFIIVPSARGDKQVADCIQFLYNNPLDNMINKVAVENRFVGYLKKVDDGYFVKETYSYLLFPLILSPWERKPDDNKLNEPIFFKLENTDNPDKATASLYKSIFIHEYTMAMQNFKNKTVIDAVVYKVTPHGIFVNVIGDKIQAKIPRDKADTAEIKPGDIVQVIITYLGKSRIVIERV